jgi:cardiolipin synthase
MVADGIWVTVGTTNFDNRSFALDEESNICVYDAALAREMENAFNKDRENSESVEVEKWRAVSGNEY